MGQDRADEGLITLDLGAPVWDKFFTVAPLVLVGTSEPDGSVDLAPKHMVTPLGWDNYIGFVCTPSHGTYQNAKRTGEFALTFPRPGGVLAASLASAPRCEDDEKVSLTLLETFPGERVSAPLAAGGYLYLECELSGIWDAFGRNSLIAGRIVAARVASDSVRRPERDDADTVAGAPLLAYLPPGRYAEISASQAFPFHSGMKR
ncbi:MAG: flavin reductase [Gemmatimonadota bacterium]|jgi:flavin reductase (DIM6/NTAB) family NADH-FMN oxidoreductase RutF